MSRETLMSRCAASIRAQWAVSSSKVMVTFFMTRFSCCTEFVSTAEGVDPCWHQCSKQADACRITDQVTALHNWLQAKLGRRGGRRVGFPRCKTRRRDRGRVGFATGAMRREADAGSADYRARIVRC